MSDLSCPARLFIARHGDAEYATPHGVLTDDGGRLSALGRDQVIRMAQRLQSENVAFVYSSRLSRAQESAALVAQELGVDTESVGGLQEYEVGDLVGSRYDDERVQGVFAAWMDDDLTAGFPGGETGAHIVERFREALESLADRHRGESVAVVTHGGVMSLAVPRLARNVRNDLARRQYLPNAVPAEVHVDADGFRVETWPGKADKKVV